jgi:Phage major capsid protein E
VGRLRLRKFYVAPSDAVLCGSNKGSQQGKDYALPTANMSQLFSISAFIEAVANIPPAPSFLKSGLFSMIELGGDQIAVDYARGSARCSPYTSKYKRAIAIPRKPYQTQWFDVPHIKVSRDIRALDLLSKRSLPYFRGAGWMKISHRSFASRPAWAKNASSWARSSMQAS